jgi:hypothetical protein
MKDMSANMNGMGLPRIGTAALAAHAVTVAGKKDEIYAPLYDSVTYPAAGTTQLTFFALPIGQGTTSAPGATGTKTEADTNLTNASLLPAGNSFYCTGIELVFLPGVLPGTGPAADSTVGQFWNDVWTFAKTGWIRFRIQNRDYIIDGPAINFPPSTRLAGIASVTSTLTSGASTMDQIAYAAVAGVPYHIVPTYITSNQAFTVQLNYPAAVALPSTQAARVFCRLRGRLIRDAQ